MTEKRFVLEEFGLNFIVNDNGRQLSARQTVDLLNELSNKNRQLDEENEQLSHDATVLICSNQEYRKENEQLKEEIKDLNDILARYEEKELKE